MNILIYLINTLIYHLEKNKKKFKSVSIDKDLYYECALIKLETQSI
jgi:hypothetical protein